MSCPRDDAHQGGGFRRSAAILVSAVVLAITLAPALREPPRDSFPLSDYPMFARARGVSSLDVVVGFDEVGQLHRVPPSAVANAEVMQAAQTIAHAVRERRARALCAEVAARVAADPRLGAIQRLEVQSRRVDFHRYFVDDEGATPLRVRRRAACEVPR